MGKKRNTLIRLFLLLAVTVAVSSVAFTTGGTAHAQEQPGTLGFSVSAVIPENQIDHRLSYFDLRMQPGQQQDLKVTVTNESDQPLTVDIAAVSASTNSNGIIDYRTPDVKDETLKIAFSEIASVKTPALTMSANSAASVIISVTMPEQEFDGVVLGGICITRQLPDQQGAAGSSSPNASIKSVYSYVIGVKLTETDTVVIPEFEYTDVYAGLTNFHPALIHTIRNTEAAIVKNMSIQVTIYQLGSNTPLCNETRIVDMAPNSVMPLSILLPEGRLDAGSYRSVVNLELSGREWTLERNFAISQALANEINDQAVTTIFKLPIWVLPLVTSLVSCVAICLVLLFVVAKRCKKDDNQDKRQVKLIYRT